MVRVETLLKKRKLDEYGNSGNWPVLISNSPLDGKMSTLPLNSQMN
jgi:hypothetical protein